MPAVAFLLNNNVGRGVLVMAAIAAKVSVLRGALSLLPGHWVTFMWLTLCLGTVVVATSFYMTLRILGLVSFHIGTGEDLCRVYCGMLTAHRKPRPPIWAYGSHMQFVPWVIYNVIAASFMPLKYETQSLRVSQVVDKTKPESDSNPRSMDDDVVLNYFPPLTRASTTAGVEEDCCSLPLDAPVILIDPGLTCTAQDVPGSSFMRRAVSRGFRVVVMERRGHARPLTKPRWNLFGDSDDLEQMVKAIQKRLPGAPLFWVGFSSGSKLPIEAMGKFDERRKNGDLSAPEFVATACICPGYNLETCFMGFGFPYKHLCLSSVKSKFLVENEAVLRSHNPEAYQRAVEASDLQTLLAHAAPFAGYPSAKEYFAAENPVLFAPLITTPTLIINSMDDPCTVAENAFGKMPGRDDGLTFVDMVDRSPCGLLLMTPSGSHCPFLDGGFLPFVRVPSSLGSWTISSWADSCVLEFFTGFLKVHRAGKPARGSAKRH